MEYQTESYIYFKTLFKGIKQSGCSFNLKSFRFHKHSISFPPSLSFQDVITYSKQCAPLSYLLDILPELSCNKYSLYNQLYESKSKEESIFKLICDDNHKVILETILKFLSYDWKKVTSRKRAEILLTDFVALLGSFDIFIQFSTTYYISRINCLQEKDYGIIFQSNNYNWLKLRYNDLILRYLTKDGLYDPFPYYRGKNIRFDGNKYSLSYIKACYKTVVELYNSVLRYIHAENITLLKAEQIESILSRLDNVYNHKLKVPSEYTLHNDFNGVDQFDIRLPSKEAINSMSLKGFNEMVDILTVCLMWMIYISSGGQISLERLQILKYSGSNHNFYYDRSFENIIVKLPFSMSRKEGVQYIHLDEKTSLFLFHYIYVIRPIYMLSLKGNYSFVKRNFFGSEYNDSQLESYFPADIIDPNLSINEYGSFVFKTQLFVGCNNGQLIKSEQFEKVSKMFEIDDLSLHFDYFSRFFHESYVKYTLDRARKSDNSFCEIVMERSGLGVGRDDMFELPVFLAYKDWDTRFQRHWRRVLF